ncbi:MAG: YtxH domain-containing protein, partial [Candidatus Margulisbacteria bacterium]|nr:YtxH domain-containing protein [Candidatus Margulisiibacteriota bacterium]
MIKKTIKALFTGGVIGAVIGLLFAPQKGDVTRKKLQKAVDKGKKKFEEIRSEIEKKEEE